MRRTLRDTAETIITAVLIFVALQATTQSFQIDGSSMDPTFLNGERVLVNRFVYARSDVSLMGQDGYLFHGPQRGDVIIFRPPTASTVDFVKRVIGVPGDEIDIRGKHVWVNGVEQNYVDAVTDARNYMQFPITVGEGEYFVLGDNRRASNDSRNWGTVHQADIVGRAWIIYWPVRELAFFS